MKQIIGIIVFLILFAGMWIGVYKYRTSGRPYGMYALSTEVLHFGLSKVSWRNFENLNGPPTDANGDFKVDENGNYVARFQHLIDAPQWALDKNVRYYRERYYTLEYNIEEDSLRLIHIKENIKKNIKIVREEEKKVYNPSMVFKKEEEDK